MKEKRERKKFLTKQARSLIENILLKRYTVIAVSRNRLASLCACACATRASERTNERTNASMIRLEYRLRHERLASIRNDYLIVNLLGLIEHPPIWRLIQLIGKKRARARRYTRRCTRTRVRSKIPSRRATRFQRGLNWRSGEYDE